MSRTKEQDRPLPETPRIYLDWNATAPIAPEAVEAMAEAARCWANPSSVHAEGRAARGRLETARERVARHLGCLPQQIVFTSGGTEALALALGGAARVRTLVSAAEHSAVLAAAPDAEVVPVDGNGVVDLAALESMLDGERPAIVALMHANNETGVIQPVEAALEIVQGHGGRLLVDAVQTAGKMKLPPADFVAVSAHKLGGPPGMGALVVRCAEDLRAVQKGGGQERGLRGGTENLPGIAGFAAALEARAADTGWMERAGRLQRRLEAQLAAAGAEILAGEVARLSTTSMVRMPGVQASTQLIQLDLAGFAVSSGSACSSGKVGASHVLAAMGVPPAESAECLRVSTGWTTGEAEIDAFCAAWAAVAERRRAA